MYGVADKIDRAGWIFISIVDDSTIARGEFVSFVMYYAYKPFYINPYKFIVTVYDHFVKFK